MEIDHVVLVARTRDDAEDLLSKAGLAIARGRAIPGLGVSNLVVPLGKTLLEITYPNGEPAAAGAPPLIELHQKAFAEPGVLVCRCRSGHPRTCGDGRVGITAE